MLDRQKGVILFQCNGCDAVLETRTNNFKEALEMLRGEQWKSSRRGDEEEWRHFCKSCQYQKERRRR